MPARIILLSLAISLGLAQAPPQQPAPAQAAPPQPVPAQTAAPAQTTPAGGNMVLNFANANLTEVIDILARRLKINYILDPRVKGSVSINTYGEVRAVEVRSLLETILRINGAAMVQVGDIFRIVPIGDVVRLPLSPQVNKPLPDDERMVLNLVFLKYTQVGDIAKLLDPFRGEGGQMSTYDPANLLLILDNARNLKRTMELISLFDSDTFATKRVQQFEVKNGRPSDIAKELENVFKAYSLSEKQSAVRFIPVDRINTIIAVAPNPGVFDEVSKWVKKLDVPVKVTAGTTDTYVYRVKYGRAETMAMAIMQLYMGFSGFGGYGMGGFGMGGYGMGMGGGFGMSGGYGGGYGMGGAYGGGVGGGYGMGGGAFGAMGGMTPGYPAGGAYPQPGVAGTAVPLTSPVGGGAPGATGDLTGSYLGAGAGGAYGMKIPHVVPNPFDNSLLVMGTPSEWDQISRLLDKLDVPPRQVLIEARIYEVSLTGAFAGGVQATLQKRDASRAAGNRGILGALSDGAKGTLTAVALVNQTKELLMFLSLAEEERKAKVISAPSVIATDSIPALINVGTEVPTLASQAIAPGVQTGGNSVFTNTVQNRNAGVSLNVVARVVPSGIVTLVISQEVSSPIAPAASSAIQSPSFSKRNVTTQVTIEDGDTIAIGGIIQESYTDSTSGIPFLSKLPGVGPLFGTKSTSKERTELVVFMTPRVIYDTNEMTEASDELRSKLRRLQKLVKD